MKERLAEQRRRLADEHAAQMEVALAAAAARAEEDLGLVVARVEENTHLLVTELHGEFLGEVRAVENLKRAQADAFREEVGQ